MQRGDSRQKRRERFRDDRSKKPRKNGSRPRNVAGPQPSRPRVIINIPLYGLRMRNTREEQRGAWATFAKRAREGVPMTQSELARRLGVDRVTVYRWETGRQRPEDVAVVEAFAQVLGIGAHEALAAAGLLPGVKPPAEPSRAPDPELDRIRESKLSPAAKARLIARIKERRQREQEQRLADLEDLIRAQEQLER